MLPDPQRQAKFDEIPEDTEILVTHQAPLDILDGPHPGNPKIDPNTPRTLDGCKILRDTVLERVKPLYHVLGHCHDGYGQMEVSGVKFINSAIVSEEY